MNPCSSCSLGEVLQADFPRQHLCIPMRPWKPPSLDPLARTALLVVGKAPGRSEDSQGQCFVGPSGKILDDWATALNFGPAVDVFLTNVVRCRLARDDAPLRKSDIAACRQHLADDVERLSSRYDRLILLALGGDAAKAFGSASLREACRTQGRPVTISRTSTCWTISRTRRIFRLKGTDKAHSFRVVLPRFKTHSVEVEIGKFPMFCTNHPAATLPSRDPALDHSVAAHLQLVSDTCLSLPSKVSFAPPRYAVPPPARLPAVVSLDIETYGILTTQPEQTVFHPRKSLAVDGVASDSLVQTVALAWYEGSRLKSTVFLWRNKTHRHLLALWLRLLCAQRGALLCMNTIFDVTYLRAADPQFAQLLRPPLLLEDVAVWNYLENSVRKERDLESLARLFGMLPLAASTGKKFHRYDRVNDPALLHYNAADSELALKLRNMLRRQLNPTAANEYTRRWFSDLLWSCTGMVEAGVGLDSAALECLHRRCEQEKQQKSTTSIEAGYGPLHGPGSASSAKKIIARGVELTDLEFDPRLKRTKVGGHIATEAANLQLLLGTLSAAGEDGTGDPFSEQATLRPSVVALSEHRSAMKIIGSYVKPLDPVLGGNARQSPIDGIVYAQWYPVPQSYGEAAGGETEGGTKQGRLTCKQPALQTAPESVQQCFTSRFRPGVLLKLDLSQIELRLAALLSGDPKMLDEYARGVDRHALRAIAFFGADVVSRPDFKSKWRHVGKQGNFWFVYRGGPQVLQEAVRRRAGVELPIEQCRVFHRQLPEHYPGLWEWQNRLIVKTTRNGYVSEPILGERRWLSRDKFINETTYESTICNFPIQVAAARLLSDIQAAMESKKRDCPSIRGVITLNCFDSVLIDCPAGETGWWENNFRNCLHHSEYRRRLEDVYGRKVPLTYDAETRSFL
jgi:uracil-DNA glycosylase family 4